MTPAGESLIDRQLHQYLVTALLGQGGMGVVYRARDVRLERDVALKVLPPGQLGDEARQRFLREARSASAFSHTNIVTIYEIDSDDGVDFIAMELVHGRPLSDYLQAGGMALERVTAFAAQMLEGMSAAHRAGLVHRDLKPGNLMIRDDGTLKILDFGLAKGRAVGHAETEAALTAQGLVMGTLAYMSPEQARGDAVGPASDVFSIGVILYEMVAGRVPFQGSGLSAMHALFEGRFEPMLEARPDCPPQLERVITRALQPAPATRYANAGEMLDDLRGVAVPSGAVAADSSAETAVLPASARPARAVHPRRRVWLAIAAGVTAVVAVAAAADSDRYDGHRSVDAHLPAGPALESLKCILGHEHDDDRALLHAKLKAERR